MKPRIFQVIQDVVLLCDGLHCFQVDVVFGCCYTFQELIPDLHELIPFKTLELTLAILSYVMIDMPDTKDMVRTGEDITNSIVKSRLSIRAESLRKVGVCRF